LIVDAVPALVCKQCGETYFNSATMKLIGKAIDALDELSNALDELPPLVVEDGKGEDAAGIGDDGSSPLATETPVPTLRARLNLSQHEFADMLGVSVRTVQGWEQGRRVPTGPARALLRIVDQHPEMFMAHESDAVLDLT
jgi:putative transcriptional regulator